MDVDAFVEDVFPVSDGFVDGLGGGVSWESDVRGVQQNHSPFILDPIFLHIPNPLLLLDIINRGLDLNHLIDKPKR
jgi:hypothetical protein